MSDELRYTVDELMARYSLEPGLKDVYVEGILDKDILERHCREIGREIVFYEIETVDIPPTLLLAHHLTDGNKQRVIALARELSSLSGDLDYRCIVDRDLDHWFGPLENTLRLVWTEFCSLDSYFFTKELIAALFKVAKAKVGNPEVFYESAGHVLTELYLMRLADRELNLKMAWLAPDKLLSIGKNGEISFDKATYIERLLNSNRKMPFRSEFEAHIKGWRVKLAGDIRLYTRGHDFTSLIAWAIGKCGGMKAFASEEAVARMLILSTNQVPELFGLLN